MIGTPNTMTLKTIVMAKPRPNRSGIPTEQFDSATLPSNTNPFPLPETAVGPDYGVGDSYYPTWSPSRLREETLLFVTANYGQNGGAVRYANSGTLMDPREAGSNEYATNKVRTVRWDPEALPGFDPRIAQWNDLPPGSYYGGRIPTAKGTANFANTAVKQNISGPLTFTSPGVASLYGS